MNKNNQGGGASVTPTLYQGQREEGYDSQTGRTNSNTGSTTSSGNSGTLNGVEGVQMSAEEFQKKLPIISPEFTLDYSDRMQKYVATLQGDSETGDTAISEAAYIQWQENNPPYQNELQNTVITKQSITELNAALDYAKKNELTPEKKAQRDAKSFTDTLNVLINLPFMFMQSNPDPTLSPEPTSIPIIRLRPSPSISTSPSSPPTPSSKPSSSNTLLPNPLPAISSKALRFKQSISSCLINRAVYEEASSKTGVSWEILAALHYNEGSCISSNSLVSGRKIGENEPDIVRSGGCSSGSSGPGIPFPLPGGGCGFKTLLDTAIYAGNHFKGKIGKAPSSFEELAKAFSRYNGGGNSNCGKTPYTSCPRLFEGEDDPYVVSMFDKKYEGMYLVYCADRTKCTPPRAYERPGAATIIRLMVNQI